VAAGAAGGSNAAERGAAGAAAAAAAGSSLMEGLQDVEQIDYKLGMQALKLRWEVGVGALHAATSTSVTVRDLQAGACR
jgi:hypothetical protein